jgi:hypothetical protein
MGKSRNPDGASAAKATGENTLQSGATLCPTPQKVLYGIALIDRRSDDRMLNHSRIPA